MSTLSENERVALMLKDHQRATYNDFLTTVRRQAKAKHIPKRKLAEMKRRLRALQKGETLRIPHQNLFIIEVVICGDEDLEARVAQDSLKLIPRANPRLFATELAESNVQLVAKLNALIGVREDGWLDELDDVVYGSPQLTEFRQKLRVFMGEIETLEVEYEDFEEGCLL